MQSTNIPLLEKFGACSVVISYFGYTHSVFLLLSQLNRRSRELLDDNYEGILNWTKMNAVCLDLQYLCETILKFPWDLFSYRIGISRESDTKIFIKLIQNINSKTGWYFNQHFINGRLCIEKLWAWENLVEKLYPYLELLKKTEVICCTE